MKKNDFSTAAGLLLGMAAVIFGMLQDGSLSTFWNAPSFFITVFGSLFAVIISFPFDTVKRLPAVLKNAFIDKHKPTDELIITFVELSKKARRNGLLSLEDEISKIEDEFLKQGIQMVVDGLEPETIKDILELEIGEMEKRHQSGIAVLKTWASLAPAFGMIGTLIGLIQMLSQLQDQSKLGPAMAVSLITSFYGALMANLVFTPLANKLELKSEIESNRREMMLEGILTIQSGVNPRILEDKLKTYLSPTERKRYQENIIQGNAVTENE
ncbi:MAG: motility protein [Caloramator sp.]|jgi:chemotaxis protein MotA|uniref:motility protein A n=1 Tax=Caloramator sp. TaxID=1871330 RepID=UPI001DEB9CF9|nr:motility protein A [Caloramator sp.]MBZ4663092.1 motility protein [Caloramator sp.]